MIEIQNYICDVNFSPLLTPILHFWYIMMHKVNERYADICVILIPIIIIRAYKFLFFTTSYTYSFYFWRVFVKDKMYGYIACRYLSVMMLQNHIFDATFLIKQ